MGVMDWFNKDYREVMKENEQLKKDIEHARLDVRDANKQNELLQKETIELKEERSDLRGNLLEVKQTIDRTQGENNDLTKMVRHREKEVEHYRGETGRLLRENEGLKFDLNMSKEERNWEKGRGDSYKGNFERATKLLNTTLREHEGRGLGKEEMDFIRNNQPERTLEGKSGRSSSFDRQPEREMD